MDSLREHPSQGGRWPPYREPALCGTLWRTQLLHCGLHGRKQPDISKQGASAQELPGLFEVSVQGITPVELEEPSVLQDGMTKCKAAIPWVTWVPKQTNNSKGWA